MLTLQWTLSICSESQNDTIKSVKIKHTLLIKACICVEFYCILIAYYYQIGLLLFNERKSFTLAAEINVLPNCRIRWLLDSGSHKYKIKYTYFDKHFY